jgi:hypothetical protein
MNTTGKSDIVHATINSSFLWRNCKVLKLTKDMRLQYFSDCPNMRLILVMERLVNLLMVN